MMVSALFAVAAVALGITSGFFRFAAVKNDFPAEALPTASGYLPLRSDRSKMFYVFYEAAEPRGSLLQAPILLWLQGGPGCSSMTGNFYEFGPWTVNPDNLQLRKNKHSWNRRFGLLFIDNPVGSGYSIAASDDDIPVNQDQVAHDLHAALQIFFTSQQPFFRNRPFFIAGESYAGKYVPALGHYMMQLLGRKSGLEAKERLRLDGLIIGNGLTHPVVQVETHAATAYSFGLLDNEQKIHAEKLAKSVVELISKEDWQGAYVSRTGLMNWIENATGLATALDVRRKVAYHCFDNGTEFLKLFLNREEVKAALNADERAEWIHCNDRVRRVMANDTMKSVKWMVEELLELKKVPVLLFQGQYDIKDGVVSSEEWMRSLEWEGREMFFGSSREIWRVEGSVAGYWRSLGGLTHVVVLGAGHMVPADQGLHAQKMIERWVDEQLVEV